MNRKWQFWNYSIAYERQKWGAFAKRCLGLCYLQY